MTRSAPGTARRLGFVARLDWLCARAESLLGAHAAAAAIGLSLLVLAAVYVTPALTTINHGNRYRAMSIEPFDLGAANDMQLRILTPLLAHTMFLRGAFYLFFPLLAGAALLAVVYFHARARGLSGSEATGVAALIAFSTPILFVLHFQGYTDTTSYLFVFLALISIHKPWAWPVCYSLALLNHESNLFVAPLILVAAYRKSRSLRKTTLVAVLLGAAVLPALLYRQHVQSEGGALLSGDFYLNWERVAECMRAVAQYLPIGFFYAFKLLWIIPLLALRQHWRSGDLAAGGFLIVGFLCAAAQLLLATDTSRLLGLAFPIIVLGALDLRATWPGPAFADWLWRLIGLNLLILPYYVGQNVALPFLPLPLSLALWYGLGIDPWSLWWGDGY